MAKVQVSKKDLWAACRKMCLADVAGSIEEVRLCTSPGCPLYKYRFGRTLRDSDTAYLGNGEYGTVGASATTPTINPDIGTRGVASKKFERLDSQ
jgi:hypothetical protein